MEQTPQQFQPFEMSEDTPLPKLKDIDRVRAPGTRTSKVFNSPITIVPTSSLPFQRGVGIGGSDIDSPTSTPPITPDVEPIRSMSLVSPTARFKHRRENGTYKRIIICCDGTWQQADAPTTRPSKKFLKNGGSGGGWVAESNVVRFSRALARSALVKLDGDNGRPSRIAEIPQIVFYQNGIGTGTLLSLGAVGAGAVGAGLNNNVCEAYFYLASNYLEGDEIFIFGFSRGAYTARSLAGLISNIGILGRRGLEQFQEIYADYTERQSNLMAWNERWHHLIEHETVKIKIVGVFDTVGSVGIPDNFAVDYFGLNDKYKFHDTQISSCVEHAFHALALDEKRHHFGPTMWYLRKDFITKRKQEEKHVPVLKQCWFPGYHIDVGGGSWSDRDYWDGFPHIAFAWMMDQCGPFLEFDPSAWDNLTKKDEAQLHKYQGNLSDYGAREVHDSGTGVFKMERKTVRTPGQYVFPDPDPDNLKPHAGHLGNAGLGGSFSTDTTSPTTKKGTKLLDVVTNETIHPVVRMRMLKWDILTRTDQPLWKPQSLAGFELARCGPEDAEPAKSVGAEGTEWKWVKSWRRPVVDKDGKTTAEMEDVTTVIYEEVILPPNRGHNSSLMMSPGDQDLLKDAARSSRILPVKPDPTWSEYFWSFLGWRNE